jgi:23S rRNA (pseudouridine1915-N3)-methyltransferase
LKLYLFFIGKPRDAQANRMAEEYIQRSSRYIRCEMREIHPARFDLFAKHAAGRKVLLDPEGKALDSDGVAALIGGAELEARDLVFLVGGADGLPPDWRPKADLLLSLSRMTFSHELARVMLAEQVYRALTMLRGHPYAR